MIETLPTELEYRSGHAATELLPLVYDELRRLAAARIAQEGAIQTLQPTALVHEAWLRVFREGDDRWQNRSHFFSAAAEAMRRILVESARRKSRLKRGSNLQRVSLDQVELATATPDENVMLIDDAIERLRAIDPQKAQVVVQKFFGGATNQEVAESLGVNERTIERHWSYAKAWLLASLQTQR